MLYAILCYHSDNEVYSWPQEQDDAVLAKRTIVTDQLAQRKKLGAAVRLMPTRASMTVHGGREPFVVDGPFAETKEQLLGFYVVECDTIDEAIAAAKGMVGDSGSLEVRPIRMARIAGAIDQPDILRTTATAE